MLALQHVQIFIAALLGGVVLSADAGVVYRFTTTSNAALNPRGGGRVSIDGDRKRVELDPDPDNPRPFDVSITKDGKTIFINLQNKTYYEQKQVAGSSIGGSSTLFHLPWSNDRIKGKPKISYRNAGAGPTMVEATTTKHVIQFRYRLRAEAQGMSLQGDVDASVTVLTAPMLPRIDETTFVRTGFDEVDGELTKYFASFQGMIVGYEISVSRKLEDGPVVTELTKMTVDELKTTDIDQKLFAIPPGLTYQEPVLGVPVF